MIEDDVLIRKKSSNLALWEKGQIDFRDLACLSFAIHKYFFNFRNQSNVVAIWCLFLKVMLNANFVRCALANCCIVAYYPHEQTKLRIVPFSCFSDIASPLSHQWSPFLYLKPVVLRRAKISFLTSKKFLRDCCWG